MGVVYAAYDPQLHRRVALKLLRGASDERLLREARLMAKLAHPNVATVHDVGVFEDRVFLAMEFVEGGTLRTWGMQAGRPLREILDVVLQAAEGLAAAHRAGLVHRDLKPDNVLVGADGRVRITDFGLAASDGEDVEAPAGTPAYMAPEQRAGAPASVSSDQFGFCVMAYELLSGERPCRDDAGVLKFEARSSSKRTLPSRVRGVLLRGLAHDPADRHPTMDVLVSALRRAGAVRTRRMAVAAAVVAAVSGVAIVARPAPPSPCSGGERNLAGVWDDGKRSAMARAFDAAGAPFAAEAKTRVRALLDAYSNEWVSEHRNTCVAAHVRGGDRNDVLARRMDCLDGRLRELRAFTSALASADRTVVEHAPVAAALLGAPSECADPTALPLPNSPALRTRIKDARDTLATATGLARAGKKDDAFVLTSELATRAKQIGYRPLEAEVLALHANVARDRSGERVALPLTMEAIDAAEASRHDALAAEGWSRMVALAGRVARFDDADRARARARAALERVNGTGRAAYLLPEAEGFMALERGRPQEAASSFREALAARMRMPGDATADTATMHVGLGAALLEMGDVVEATHIFAKAHEQREAIFGPRHPLVAESLEWLAAVYRKVGRYGDARRTIEQAVAIMEAAGRESDPELADVLFELAIALRNDGEPLAAVPVLERAERLIIATFGPEHQYRGNVFFQLALVHRSLSQPAKAQSYVERSLANLEKTLGPDHPKSASRLDLLGDLALDRHDVAGALKHHQDSLSILEKERGGAHASLANPLIGLARAYLAEGRADLALPHAERALAMRERAAATPGEVADAQFALAQARGSVTLAEAARDNYERDGRGSDRARTSVVDWLARHR
jgi:tetratricopeptide (TPR) repeat protein